MEVAEMEVTVCRGGCDGDGSDGGNSVGGSRYGGGDEWR